MKYIEFIPYLKKNGQFKNGKPNMKLSNYFKVVNSETQKIVHEFLTLSEIHDLIKEGYELKFNFRNVKIDEGKFLISVIESQKQNEIKNDNLRKIIIEGGFTNYIKKLEGEQ